MAFRGLAYRPLEVWIATWSAGGAPRAEVVAGAYAPGDTIQVDVEDGRFTFD